MPEQTTPRISAIICTWNRAHELVGALEAFGAQTLPRSDWELVVVDNNSTDTTQSVIQQAAKRGDYTLVSVFEKEQGHSRARNAGIAASRAPLIAFTDDDCLPEPDWLETIVRIFDEHPEVALLGGPGPSVFPDTIRDDPRRQIIAARFFGDFKPYDSMTEIQQKNPPMGLNFSFRREVAEAVGGFDVRLGIVGANYIAHEETAFARRAQELGYRVFFDPRPVVRHRIQDERITWQNVRKMAREGGAGSYMSSYAPRIGGSALKRLAFSGVFAAEWMYSSVRSVIYAPSFRKRINARFRALAAAGKLRALWRNR